MKKYKITITEVESDAPSYEYTKVIVERCEEFHTKEEYVLVDTLEEAVELLRSTSY